MGCNTCDSKVEDNSETCHYIDMTISTHHNRMLGHLGGQSYERSKSLSNRHIMMESLKDIQWSQ